MAAHNPLNHKLSLMLIRVDCVSYLFVHLGATIIVVQGIHCCIPATAKVQYEHDLPRLKPTINFVVYAASQMSESPVTIAPLLERGRCCAAKWPNNVFAVYPSAFTRPVAFKTLDNFSVALDVGSPPRAHTFAEQR
jgi:hypothetical protein